MIRYKSSKQLSLEGFNLPFGGQLNAKNRWVKWSQVIPWDDLASCYYKTMGPTKGRPGKDARLVIGALIINHKLNLSDEETILQIQENHYLQHLYVQQDGMYQNRQKRCDDRIVSISQPHVRPIVRGKASKKTEFGAKISVSMNNGLAFVDHIGWDAFNESTDLKQHVEEYRRRFGYYPEVVLADQLYGSRYNRKHLKEKGIRFGGKALGRPPKETAENSEKIRAMKKQRIQDSRERIPIEGKFGQGKNGYRLNYI